MIRVSVNTGGAAEVREYEKPEEALGYIQLLAVGVQGRPFSFTWEDVKPCEHDWRLFDADEEKFVFMCDNDCPQTRVVTQAQIGEIGVKP